MAGRKKAPAAKPGTDLKIVGKTPPAVAAQEIAWREADAESLQRASAIARELRYEEELSIGALEDGVRFYQIRTVEAYIELGKRLLLLKELTPHGEFGARVERLGFADGVERRYMRAAAKAAKSDIVSDLARRVKNVKVFNELLAADDDALQELAEMDDIDSMTAAEARRRLRDARADLSAKDDRAAKREREIERKTAEIARLKRQSAKTTPEELAVALRHELVSEALGIEVMIVPEGKDVTSLRTRVAALIEHGDEHGEDHRVYIAGVFAQLERCLHLVRCDYGIPAQAIGDPEVEARLTLDNEE